MSIALDFIAQQDALLKLMGTDLTYKHGAAVVMIRGAVIPFGKDDEALINAYGIEARKIQIGKVEPIPKKFDTISDAVTNTTYSIHDIHAAVVDGQLVGYRLVVKS